MNLNPTDFGTFTFLPIITLVFIIITLFHHFSKEMKFTMEKEAWNTRRFTVKFPNIDNSDAEKTQNKRILITNEIISIKHGKKKSLMSEERYPDEIKTIKSEDILCSFFSPPKSSEELKNDLKEYAYHLESRYYDDEKKRIREFYKKTELTLIISTICSIVSTIVINIYNIMDMLPSQNYIIAIEGILIYLLLVSLLSFILFSYAYGWKKAICGIATLLPIALFIIQIV